MLETLLNDYGYPALLVGTFLEGETILILAAVAAHLGYLSLEWVIVCAFLGTLCGDQLYFYLGRRHGPALLEKRPAWKLPSERVSKILESYPVLLILGFRFLYGIRTITPFAIGMSKVSYTLFTLLNLTGAALWATVIGVAGYYFGRTLETVIGDIKHYELEIMVLIGLIGAVLWGVFYYRRKRH